MALLRLLGALGIVVISDTLYKLYFKGGVVEQGRKEALKKLLQNIQILRLHLSLLIFGCSQ
jgi:hypothetical protein